jgi:hypothetical protein
MKKQMTFLMALVMGAGIAQAAEPEWDIGATYRPRAEIDHRFGDNANFFITHRARASVGLTQDQWSGFVQVQDVRTWGTEPGTATHQANVDLHQGFASYSYSPTAKLTIGRQEISYLNHRLIGNLDWAQPGRSFDAARATLGYEKVGWDIFAATISEATGKGRQDGGIVSTVVQWDNAGRKLAAIGVADWSPWIKMDRYTFGPYSEGKLVGPLAYRVEGYWQTGELGNQDLKAYLGSAELAFAAAPFRVSGGYDRVSGAGNGYTAFDTLYATNHKFYGYMDLFLALPRDTRGAGLQDAYGQVAIAVSKMKVSLTGHRFWTERPAGQVFGTEWDAVLDYSFSKVAQMQLAYGILAAGEAFKVVRPNAPDYPNWTSLMLTVNL